MKAICLLVVLSAACGSAQRDAETLTDSIRSYNEGVRWQRFAVAANHIPPAQRATFVEEMDERADDVRVTDYELVKVDNRGPKEARVQVKVSWYRDTEGTLRETHAIQTWERHGKAWWMVDETRMKGAELPGLTSSALEAPPNPALDAPDDDVATP